MTLWYVELGLEESRESLRISLNDAIRFVLPSGLYDTDARLRFVNGDGSTNLIPLDYDPAGCGELVWKPSCTGPTLISVATLRGKSYLSSQATKTNDAFCKQSCNSRIHCAPNSPFGDDCLSGNVFSSENDPPMTNLCQFGSVCGSTRVDPEETPSATTCCCLRIIVESSIKEPLICSVISQKLGSLRNWSEILKVAKYQKFSAIHLTPINELGSSRSSYSIRDPLSISSKFLGDAEEAIVAADIRDKLTPTVATQIPGISAAAVPCREGAKHKHGGVIFDSGSLRVHSHAPDNAIMSQPEGRSPPMGSEGQDASGAEADPAAWRSLAHEINKVHMESGIVVFTDLVLNHLSSDSLLFVKNPSFGYNEENSPWLSGPIELDLRIQDFNVKFCNGTFNRTYQLDGPWVRSEEEVSRLLKAFKETCLDPFKLHEYFRVDIDRCQGHFGATKAPEPHLVDWRKWVGRRKCAGDGSDKKGPETVEDWLYLEALKVVGIDRSGIVIPGHITRRAFVNRRDLEKCLQTVQNRLWAKKDLVYAKICESFCGTIRYERLEAKKGPCQDSPYNSLVPRYFTTVLTEAEPELPTGSTRGSELTCQKKKGGRRELHLANNGWVMGWNAMEDFADEGALVYFERSLIAWTDCIKLRYGKSREDNPQLWDLMAEYAQRTARHFHGVRLDNCHSTPLTLGDFIMRKVRAIRPDIYVFAELFTGSSETDRLFENTLGLDGLVREAIQTSSTGDLAWHSLKFGAPRLGSLPCEPAVFNVPLKDSQLLSPRRAANIFYDCTHDNETAYQKNRPQDVLACTALVAASDCSFGSTFGYETLVKENPSVICDGLYYRTLKLPPEESVQSVESTPDASDRVRIEWHGDAHEVLLWGSFNNWASGLRMGRADGSRDWWLEVELDALLFDCDRIEVKFVVDGEWRISESYPIVKNKAHLNNLIYVKGRRPETSVDLKSRQHTFALKNNSPGIIEARQLLLALKRHNSAAAAEAAKRPISCKAALFPGLEEGPFDMMEVQWILDDLVIIEKHSRTSNTAVVYIVRSHRWKGSDHYPVRQVQIPGQVKQILFSAFVTLDQTQFQTPPTSSTGDQTSTPQYPDDFKAFIQGMADTRSCLRTLPVPNYAFDPNSNTTCVDLAYFPSGSVFIVHTGAIVRPDLAASRILQSRAAQTIKDLPLETLACLLWSCEQEERDRSHRSRGVYEFPGMEPQSVFAGVGGVAHAFHLARQAQRSEDGMFVEPPPIVKNVKDGHWLVDYHLTRVREIPSLRPMISSFEAFREAVVDAQRSSTGKTLTPAAYDKFFVGLYQLSIQAIFLRMGLGTGDSSSSFADPLVYELAVASTHLVSRIASSSLPGDGKSVPNWWQNLNESGSATVSAGLPFFAKEYMREWGRDTFLAAPGLLLGCNRFDNAKQEIIGYGNVLRHAQIPNLLDSGNRPRYNARDAVWFWALTVRDYFRTKDKSILLEGLSLRWPDQHLKFTMHDLQPTSIVPTATSTPALAHRRIDNVRDAIQFILSAHYHGIEYREFEAGKSIDEQMIDPGFNVRIRTDPITGFCVGGNRSNCGTWMDKMGSSEKAGNKGQPSSPRDGAPVELTCALYAVLDWICTDARDYFPSGTTPIGRESGIEYTDWRDRIKASFAREYLIKEEDARRFPNIAILHTLKDVWKGEKEDEDFFLRPNFMVGLSFAPDILPRELAIKAIDIGLERLMPEPNQVGLKTLDPANYRFRANYDNANDSVDKNLAHGWNYHQGPEWVWPLGNCLQARLSLDPADLHFCLSRLRNARKWIRKGPWYSLPELMDSNGRICVHSCQSQAWSIGTILAFFRLCQRLQPLRAELANQRNQSEAKKVHDDEVMPSSKAHDNLEFSKPGCSSPLKAEKISLEKIADGGSRQSGMPEKSEEEDIADKFEEAVEDLKESGNADEMPKFEDLKSAECDSAKVAGENLAERTVDEKSAKEKSLNEKLADEECAVEESDSVPVQQSEVDECHTFAGAQPQANSCNRTEPATADSTGRHSEHEEIDEIDITREESFDSARGTERGNTSYTFAGKRFGVRGSPMRGGFGARRPMSRGGRR